MAAKAKRRAGVQPYWATVRLFAKCSNGCDIHAGDVARFGLPRHGRRPAMCRRCAAGYGLFPPGADPRRHRDGKAAALPEEDR